MSRKNEEGPVFILWLVIIVFSLMRDSTPLAILALSLFISSSLDSIVEAIKKEKKK